MYRDETHTQTPHNTDHNNTTRHNKTPQRTRHHKNAGKPRQTTPHDITQRSYMAPQWSYVAQPTRQNHNTTQRRDTTHDNKPDNTEHNTTTNGKTTVRNTTCYTTQPTDKQQHTTSNNGT
jgi:hypothetical protein